MTALILSEMLDWSAGTDQYLSLSKKNNREWGPVLVRRGSDDNIVVLDDDSQAAVEATDVSLASFLAAADAQTPTRFHFGTRTGYAKRFRVMSLVPRAVDNIEVGLVVEDNRVFEADFPSLNYATPKNSAKWLFLNCF